MNSLLEGVENTEKGMSDEKAKGSPTPYDLAFKQFLIHPDTARGFMQRHLPQNHKLW